MHNGVSLPGEELSEAQRCVRLGIWPTPEQIQRWRSRPFAELQERGLECTVEHILRYWREEHTDDTSPVKVGLVIGMKSSPLPLSGVDKPVYAFLVAYDDGKSEEVFNVAISCDFPFTWEWRYGFAPMRAVLQR